jgi:hypothetical protein
MMVTLYSIATLISFVMIYVLVNSAGNENVSNVPTIQNLIFKTTFANLGAGLSFCNFAPLYNKDNVIF